MVLKGVPGLISPDLLHVLASMGHGDKLVLADANFPSASVCGEGGARLVRADGHSIPDLLQAVLTLLPLDTYVFTPVSLACCWKLQDNWRYWSSIISFNRHARWTW